MIDAPRLGIHAHLFWFKWQRQPVSSPVVCQEVSFIWRLPWKDVCEDYRSVITPDKVPFCAAKGQVWEVLPVAICVVYLDSLEEKHQEIFL